jgi:hypothetical protein
MRKVVNAANVIYFLFYKHIADFLMTTQKLFVMHMLDSADCSAAGLLMSCSIQHVTKRRHRQQIITTPLKWLPIS